MNAVAGITLQILKKSNIYYKDSLKRLFFLFHSNY